MNLPTKEEIKAHLKTRRKEFPRKNLADKLGISLSTLNNSLAQSAMSDSMRLSIAKITDMLPTASLTEQVIPDNLITLKIPHEEYTKWEKAALLINKTASDWLITTGNERAETILEEEFNITPLKTANIRAAAGSPVNAELIDWDGSNPIINVEIYGLSMEPMFNDGQIVKFKHKSQSRSPYMGKGKIYLVQYDGGFMVKRYNTRPARPDEADVEYLTSTGKVGVLESINPDYPNTDITGSFDWIAWYEG